MNCSSATASTPASTQSTAGPSISPITSAPAGIATPSPPGPQAPSSATINRAPLATACGRTPTRFVVITTLAPASPSFAATARAGSSGVRCTTIPPTRRTAKNATGCAGLFGSSSPTASPGRTPAATNPRASRSTRAPSSENDIPRPRNEIATRSPNLPTARSSNPGKVETRNGTSQPNPAG